MLDKQLTFDDNWSLVDGPHTDASASLPWCDGPVYYCTAQLIVDFMPSSAFDSLGCGEYSTKGGNAIGTGRIWSEDICIGNWFDQVDELEATGARGNGVCGLRFNVSLLQSIAERRAHVTQCGEFH
jgi:hypothetical protein